MGHERKAAPRAATRVVREVVTKPVYRDRIVPAKAPKLEPTIMVIRGGNIEMVQR